MPKITVFLPTYNRADIIKNSIESILSQTFSDFELLIVDDGSTDNTKEVVESFTDKRIRYIKKEENLGLTARHNTAINEARGQYMATLGSDDVWHKEHLEKTFEALERSRSDVGIAYTQLRKHFRDGRTELVPKKGLSGNLFVELLKGNFITMQVALLKMKCFEDNKFDENVIALQDWEIWLRIAKKWEFVYVPYIGCDAFVMPDSITSKKKLRLESRRKIFDKHKEVFRKYPKILAHHAFNIGHSYSLLKNTETSSNYLKIAVFSQPWNIKYLFSYGLVRLSILFNRKGLYKKIAKLIVRLKR